MYTRRIKQKIYPWGAIALATELAVHENVSIAGSVRGGARLAGSDTFADIHAAMLLEGTRTRSKKDVQNLLDSLGASLSFSAGSERLMFTAHVRRPNADRLLALIAEILREASFPEKELEILKKREMASLALEAQDTRAQADIALSRLLFKPEHPNSNETTEESRRMLGTITAQKLVAYHAQILDCASLVISIAGDFPAARVFSLVRKNFKDLPRHVVEALAYEPSAPGEAIQSAVYIKHKANIDYLAGIATGMRRNHPDYPALALGLQILGNPRGFAGRLMKTVREQEGLTYGTYAYLTGFAEGADGYLKVYGTFAPQLFAPGRSSIAREIQRIVRDGITGEELRKHKDLFSGSFRVQLSNSMAFASAAHDIVAEGRPLSYLDLFPKQIRALTKTQVNRALRKYLIPERLSEAAAGPVDEKMLKQPIDSR